MKIAIGKIIQDRLTEVGLSKKEFARRINCSTQNIFSILERDSLDTQLLIDVSKALDHNFFNYYYYSLKNEINNNLKDQAMLLSDSKGEAKIKEKDILKLKEEIQYLNLQISYLNEINNLLKEKLKNI